ncbi:hypothetical protein QZH41_008755, partial [Actinostola sp. cb2023]
VSVTEEMLISAVCRIFNVTWKSPISSEHTYLPGVANDFVDNPTAVYCNMDDLISQALIERLSPAYIKTINETRMSVDSSTIAEETSQMVIDDGSINDTQINCESFKSLETQNDSLEYLMECYERVTTVEKAYPKRLQDDSWTSFLSQARQQCISFTILVLMNVLTRERVCNISPLVPYLVQNKQKIPRGFINDLVISAGNDEEIATQVFKPILLGMMQEMRKITLVDENYKTILMSLSELCEIRLGSPSVRPICNTIVSLDCWLPRPLSDAVGKEIEKLSFLGPFFSLSVFADDSPKVVQKYYSSRIMTKEQIKLTTSSLQSSLEFVRTEMFKVMHSLLVSSASREACLEYIGTVLNRNVKKAQLQADDRQVASDGFMMNFMAVLQQLCIKVKIEKVDNFYLFHPKCRLDISSDSRLKATSNDVKQWKEQIGNCPSTGVSEPKFPTECFYMAYEAHHQAVIPCFRRYTRRLRAIRDLSRTVEHLETQESEWMETPVAARNKMLLKKWRAQIEKLATSKMTSDAGLVDERILQSCFKYYGMACRWLLNMVKPNTERTLPLSIKVPQEFAALPDFVIEDIAEFLLFINPYTNHHHHHDLLLYQSVSYTNHHHHDLLLYQSFTPIIIIIMTYCFINPHAPQVYEDPAVTDIAEFLIVFACSPHYISNPYLVAKIVEVIFVLNPNIQPRTAKVHELIMGHRLAQEFLAPSLMKFYTDVETTGSSNEFYDKFSIRYHISIIMKSLWDDPFHRMSIIKESSTDGFVRFVNMLINDTIFLLDESLDSLKRINEIQQLMANTGEWEALSREIRTSRQRQLDTDERQCRSYLTLASETLDMMHYLTKHAREPFLRPELIDRLAAMLNFNLQQLCGPKCRNLKVKSPEKYGFEPKKLLDRLIDIYLHLSSDEFANAVASDQRSYRKYLFEDACRHLQKTLMRSEVTLQINDVVMQFQQFVNKVEQKEIENASWDEDFDDAPDEFKGQLSCEIEFDCLQTH